MIQLIISKNNNNKFSTIINYQLNKTNWCIFVEAEGNNRIFELHLSISSNKY
jgi:hypothetical protein